MANALLVAVIIVLVVLAALAAAGGPREPMKAGPAPPGFLDLAAGYPYGYSLATTDPAQVQLNRLYSSAEVDPLVTGQLYAGPRAAGVGRRQIYGGRTSFGRRWGMHEYSAGVPGQAGVDVGLLGMREYSLDPGAPDVFDDGIPAQWKLPSTPVNWYVPQFRDYYDVEAGGPAVYAKDLMSLQEPDHEPLMS